MNAAVAHPDGSPRDLTARGPEAVTLLTEVAPWLEAIAGITVEVTGDQPALREATDAPQVSLTVTDGTADRAGNVWFPTEHYGVYRYDGETFPRFGEEDGLLSPAVQCTFEDREGRIWVGGYRGLYRYDGNAFVNLTEMLPWP